MAPTAVTHVPIGGLAAIRAPGALATLLGSCVGLIVQDLRRGVAVLGHVVRPDGNGAGMGPAYFADRALPAARDLALQHGAHPHELLVRLAGGGKMIAGVSDIGVRNAKALQEATHALGLTFGGMLDGPRNGGCMLLVDAATGKASVRGLNERAIDESSWQKLQTDLTRS